MTSTTNYSSLRSMKRIELSQQVPLASPFTIYLETTNICNFKCIFCPESFANYKEKAGGMFNMSMEDFEFVAGQIKSLGHLKVLNLYMMGEPFANKNLCKMISLSKSMGLADKVMVTTNGSLVKASLHQELLDSGLDYLRVSIYGGDQDNHARKTQNKLPLERIKDNIAGLKALRDSQGMSNPHIYAKMIQSEDDQENQSFLSMFTSCSDEVTLEPVMNWNDPTEGNLAGMDTESMLATKNYAIKKKACPFPFYTLVVHSDLSVSVCCVDWDKQTTIGNLRDSTLVQLWGGEKLRDFQLAHIEHRRKDLASCKNCNFLHTGPDNLDDLSSVEFMQRWDKEHGK